MAQMLGSWVTCGVKMMWLCHGWVWQPHQTAYHIHIRCIQSVWAHWYAIHRHTISALHSYTHPTSWLWFWGSGSLVESKWWHYIMVEADSHLKLLPTSILDIYTVFEHIDMLSIGIQYQPYTVIPTLLGLDFGVQGHLWSQMMWLCHGWVWQPPQTASHIHNPRHIQSVLAHWYAVHWHILAAIHSFTLSNRLRFQGSGSLVVVESKWCHYVIVKANSQLKLLPPSILDIYKVFEHIDMLSIGIF
jgi:hypothetical protein